MIQPLNASARRSYILDTNVLIHDPAAVLKFDEHEVLIPMTVLEELDGLKTGRSDTARSARQATRNLSQLLEGHSPAEVHAGIPIHKASGVGGTLRFLPTPDLSNSDTFHQATPDNLILAAAIAAGQAPSSSTPIVISKDVNLQVKAAALDLRVEDYRHDSVLRDSDSMSDGVWRTGRVWGDLEAYELGGESASGRPRYAVRGDAVAEWHPGMLVRDDEGFEAIVRRHDDREAEVETCSSYRNGRNLWGVNARDAHQNFAMNLLMDDTIDLVSLAGAAGTGKTFIVMAAALSLVFDERAFERVVITRETTPMGEEIGFLPGTEEEKMNPWMGAFQDNLNELLRVQDENVSTAARHFLESRVQMRSMGFMRGRTFTDTLLIIDEAQNLTPRQVKSLATRAGRNTKLIFMGNVGQIDTPYLTPSTCGLAYLVERFLFWPHAGHVTLRTVERSRLAQTSEEVL
ncbi:PhoH-like protein [Spiribacter salinus M19-40]|uniref:PhoH-like protein n=2 Tax=Spiribacter salinus TaxID=1335746 RepID=R4VN66_9GAMM|nr:PhoH family protein [Spiribacter salinus]AGM41013.1 PhoH-like protein [Spiribacter salinus M19-40]MDR9454936.1 PhoH family protein [Spiribacter sp.]TQE97799.1 MAG: PhoH family protein [Spiribacter salinus]